MYIKWIVCTVPNNKKEEFSLAQEAWSKNSKSKGFIGQTGGWNLKNNNETCIISFWNDKESLTNFMNYLHDNIFIKNKQSETYTSITVTYFNRLLSMEGSKNSIAKIIKNAKLLRIADCNIKSDKKAHFEKVQKSIWLPTMKNATGMLGGEFSLNETDTLNYLVSTFWDTEENHQNYVENQLPINQKLANISANLQTNNGKIISIEKKWNVFKIPTSF